MRRLPLRRILSGPDPSPDRLLFHSLWFRGHNNPRYEELLPRLERLDGFLLTLPAGRIPRGVAYRAARTTRDLRYRLLLRHAARRYRGMFTADNEQIPFFPGPSLADVDDPYFTEREAGLLRNANLRAYVVTAERAARRFEQLGVEKPWHVIPQGVSLGSLDEPERAAIAERRSDVPFVAGYMAAWLLTAGDRGAEHPDRNVDHLLELWAEVVPRVPGAQLWLVGGASDALRSKLAGRGDVVLTGRLPRGTALAHVANFDVALYPRAEDRGIQSAKVAEYMGAGVPTLSYDYAVTEELRDTGAGVLVESPREFAEALVALAGDKPWRRGLAAAARAAGAARDWDVLARRYAEILDLHLPR